jgi:hypothetical protein
LTEPAQRLELSNPHHAARAGHPVLAPVSRSYPEVKGRSPTCYSPVRRSDPTPKSRISARLACVRHAASVHPEPGSNSPSQTHHHTTHATSVAGGQVMTHLNPTEHIIRMRSKQPRHPRQPQLTPTSRSHPTCPRAKRTGFSRTIEFSKSAATLPSGKPVERSVAHASTTRRSHQFRDRLLTAAGRFARRQVGRPTPPSNAPLRPDVPSGRVLPGCARVPPLAAPSAARL